MRGIKIEIQQRILAQSDRNKLLDLRLRIITTLCRHRYFVERSIGNLLDLEKAMNVRFNVKEYPITHYNLPRLRVQEFVKKSLNKKAVFSTVDLKLMIGNCSTYLNLLAANPVFMVGQLRTFLGVQNLNFREVDVFAECMAREERANQDAMMESVRKIEEEPEDLRKSSLIELRDSFRFKGVDRTTVFGKHKYNLFCSLGQSKWYAEKTLDDFVNFIQSLRKEDTEKKAEWLRYVLLT